MPDPQLDDLLTQSKQDLEKVNQLQGSLSYGLAQDPAQQRQVQSTARALGVTPDIVQQNPRAMHQAARINGFDFDAFARTYPVTTQILSNPMAAAAAHDDLETYKTLESMFDKRAQAGEFKDLTPSQLDAVKQDAIARGIYDSRLWNGGGTAGAMTKFTDLLSSISTAVVTPFSEAVKSLTPAPEDITKASTLGPWWLSPGALAHAGARKLEGLVTSGAMAEAPPQLRDPATGQMFNNPLYQPWALKSVPKRVAEMAGTLGAMAAGGEITAPLFAFNAGKAKLDEVYAKTGSAWKALTEGFGFGLANLALLTKVPPPVRVEGQGIGITALKQTARAVPLAGGMTIIDNTLRQLHEPDADFTKGFTHQLITFALYENVHTVNALASRVGTAYQNYQYLGKLNDAIKASKMAAEDPQAFQEHLSQLAKDAEVGMPADQFTRYWQAQGEDPSAKAQEMGITNFEEALATGTDAQIPIDRFLAATVGTPHFEELSKDIRLTPGAPTLREADLQAQTFADNVKASQAELEKMATTETEHPDREEIYKRVQAELLAAGGEAAKTADETAKLLTNFSINMADRANKDLLHAAGNENGKWVWDSDLGMWSWEARPWVAGDTLVNQNGKWRFKGTYSDVAGFKEPDVEWLGEGDRPLFVGSDFELEGGKPPMPTTAPVQPADIAGRLNIFRAQPGQETSDVARARRNQVPSPAGRAAGSEAGALAGEAQGRESGPDLVGAEPGTYRTDDARPDGRAVANLTADPKLQSYQLRSVPVVQVGDRQIVAGPRPPYFSFHGNGETTGGVVLSTSPRNVAGDGVYIAQTHDVASAPAHTNRGAGQVLSVYVDTSRLVALDARTARTYTPEDAAALGLPGLGYDITGQELLVRLNQEFGAGTGLTRHLNGLGFNAVAYDYASQGHPAWSVFDPTLFKRITDTKNWSPEEIARRESFDPTPMKVVTSEGGDQMGRVMYQPQLGEQKPVDVTSPEFKRWFGEDSTLVNDDGSPMRLFHGTDANIEAFKTSERGAMGGDAVYLGQAREASEGYGSKVMEVYARGKYLDNYEWTGYIDKYGWGGAREAAMRDGWAGVRDDKFEDAVAVWDPKNIKSATSNTGAFDETSRIYHQSPVFYSALERAVPDMAKIADKSGEVQPEQAKAWLAARQKEGKFKQAELDAIGVNDWLDLQKGKVPVSAVQDFIKQNGVQVQEVMKGGPGQMPVELRRFVHEEFGNNPPQTADEWIKQADRAERVAQQWQRNGDPRQADRWFTLSEQMNQMAENLETPSGGSGAVRYSDYQLPGGQDYRELLLTLPDNAPISHTAEAISRKYGIPYRETNITSLRDAGASPEEIRAWDFATSEAAPAEFRSSHWDEPNILAHIRFNSRTDAEGRKVLFIEEIQSDWGQKGKKEGFQQPVVPDELQVARDGDGFIVTTKDGGFVSEVRNRALIERKGFDWSEEGVKAYIAKTMEEQPGRFANDRNKVPTAPFVTDTKAWVSLALKRMIRYAADNGFDRVAFVNGEQSADRYDLSKQVSQIDYKKTGDDRYHIQVFDINDRAAGAFELSAQELADHVGKDLAQKIVDGATDKKQELTGLDLKVGGEGMKAFYDKIVPSVANDVLKKLGGGKVGEVQIPQRQETDTDRLYRQLEGVDAEQAKGRPVNMQAQLGFDITPELKAKVQEGQPLFQPTAGAGGPRGFLEFGPDKKFNLGLLNDDKSTPIHELGHFYLEVLHDLSSQEGTSQQVKQDYSTIRKWLGAEGDAPLTVEQHEQFARAHELYMREGKAPTEGLRGAFQRFGRWLTKLYQTAEQLQVPMTDEVRGVFDRLYASDTEIEAARKAVGDLPMFATAKDMGVTEREFKAYKKLKDAEITSAKEKLLAELVRQADAERKAEWREGLAQKREEVAAELDADPAYIALKALTEGQTAEGIEVKLSREALVEKYGEAVLKSLGRGKGYVYASEGGMDADSAALLLGHESGDALVEALSGLEPRGKRIAREALERMRAEHGDLITNEPALKAKALEELHSTRREEVLALELKALNRLKRGVQPIKDQLTAEQRQAQADREALAEAQSSVAKAEALKSASEKRSIEQSMPPMRAYRIAASAFIDNLPLAKTDPNKYLLAQRKSGKEAFDLQGRGDYAAAAEAKQQEILNHFMYLEATRARQEGEKAFKFAQRLQTPRVTAKLARAGGTYLDQVNALMDRFEFGRVSNKELERRETLAQWVEAQTNMNEEPAIADKFLDESFKVNYRQLTNADLRDLFNAMKNIKHLAYRQLEVVLGDRRVEFKELVDQLDTAARANNKVTPLPLPSSNETTKQKAHDFLAGKDAAMVKIEQMVNWLDGNNVNGPWHEAIWNPIAKAETADYDLITKVTGKLMDALDQMPKEQQSSMADLFEVPGINQPLNRRQLITMLFNMGTDMNRMKLIEGYADYGFTPETVDAALSNLNRHDTAFVQGVWNTIGDLWPQIVDLQKRLTGVEPKREEPTPVTIRFKDGTSETLEGGYFPLKAAAGRSTVAGKQESSATALFDYGGGYVKATTMTGHTKERTAAVYPLDLDFTHIIAQHTTQVVKDLTHREAVILANRLLTHPTVRKAMQEAMGEAYTGQFMPWLRSIANDRNGAAASSASSWTNVATATRGNLVAALLGFKFSTVIVQLTDPLRVVGPGDYRVPVPTYTKALLDYIQHPIETAKMVRELSGEMRHRPENLDRDIRAQWEHLQGDASWKAAWNRKAFHGLGMIDALTSVPSWLGAYRHALASGETPENAVFKADRTVRLTLMSGSPKDLLGVQRDPDKFMKLITMFMGDGPAQYGLLRNAGRKGLKGIPEFTAVAVMMSMANIIGDTLKGQTPAPGEDKKKFYLRKALLAWSQPIPIVRDLANATDSKLAGKPFSDYRLSPVLAVGQKVVDTIGDVPKLVEGKEDYPDFAIKAFDLLGTVAGIGGTSQAVASAKYLRRVQKGEEKPKTALELAAGVTQGKPKQGVK